jgi:hypothetical protein
MAIFKAGKRIGPFDISGGISRGDFKGSAYHKTDRDPRFKMRANPENTIGRFRAAMASAEGYARPNRFAVRIFPPSNLNQIIKNKQETTAAEGQTFDNEMYNGTGQVKGLVDGGVMNSLTQTIGRQINIHCDTVSMPGIDLQQQEIQYGSEPARNMVTGHGFAGNIVATFYADKYLRERQFFELWQKLAVNTISHKANYYDNYVGKMHIYQLGSNFVGASAGSGSAKDRDMPTYAVEAIDVYPEKINPIEYAYGTNNTIVKITVEFSYRQWFNMGIESAAGLEFGHSMQTAANIKARTPGLFGKLPPSLQRVGRGVMQQGRTVLNPVGRIFKGKVFPPFT